MLQVRLSNADVGTLRRALDAGDAWLLPVATRDWLGAWRGERVRLTYAGDALDARPPVYPEGEWFADVAQVRTIQHAGEITPEDVGVILGLGAPRPESRQRFPGQAATSTTLASCERPTCSAARRAWARAVSHVPTAPVSSQWSRRKTSPDA